MRQSILEGLNFSRQNHPLPFPPPPAMPFYPASMYPRHFGPVPPPQGRGRGFAGKWWDSSAKLIGVKCYLVFHIPQTELICVFGFIGKIHKKKWLAHNVLCQSLHFVVTFISYSLALWNVLYCCIFPSGFLVAVPDQNIYTATVWKSKNKMNKSTLDDMRRFLFEPYFASKMFIHKWADAVCQVWRQLFPLLTPLCFATAT